MTMISSGMADFGYQYVNVDDGWPMKPGSTEPELSGAPRDPQGVIRPNDRFKDMAALAAYIHSKGLKAGLYSSPARLTARDITGSYQHEALDAKTFAAWGFDFLKYDWCSYGNIAPKNPTIADYRKPYDLMGGLFKQQDRDIVLNLCQYGMGDVWTWGRIPAATPGAPPAISATKSASGCRASITLHLPTPATPATPGPATGTIPTTSSSARSTTRQSMNQPQTPVRVSLTADEQYSYMSMWALMASPLFFGGDMSALDDFTWAFSCNSEVIDVDQDALGWQGRVVRQSADEFILEKPLEDGSVAVGLFNLSESPRNMSVSLTDLGLDGSWKVRDLWRQKEIGSVSGTLFSEVAPHGVTFVHLSSVRKSQ